MTESTNTEINDENASAVERETGTVRKVSEIAGLVDRQRAFFKEGISRSWHFRHAMLTMLETALRAWELRLMEAVHADLGRSHKETYVVELAHVHAELRHVRRHLRSWTRAKFVPTPYTLLPGVSKIIPEPFGVNVTIVPWNYPLLLSLVPMINAIAAGNTVIVKPSELGPHTSETLAAMADEYFSPEFVGFALGGPEMSTALISAVPDHICFTGSTKVGTIIAKQAAEHLIPVILELGGKSPCIVLEDADIEVSARRIAWGKLINAGQSCNAPDYVMVHNSIRESFVKAVIRYFAAYFAPGINPEDTQNVLNAIRENPEFPRIITESHTSRIEGLIATGTVRFGGIVDKKNRYVSPTVIENPSLESDLMKEEIFGPVLPVIGYDDLEDVFSTIDARPTPLAFYVFTRDRSFAKRIMSRMRFGGGAINDVMLQIANHHLPFGGLGPSGMGRHHGKAGFDAFSCAKGVISRSMGIDVGLRFAPRNMPIETIKTLLR